MGWLRRRGLHEMSKPEHTHDLRLGLNNVGMMNDVGVISRHKDKVCDGLSDIVCVEDHRDIILIWNMLMEIIIDIRIQRVPAMPGTLSLYNPLSLDCLKFKGPKGRF